MFTSATWTDGVDTRAVAAEVGLGPVPDLEPERFRVTDWPSEPVLSRLRDRAVEL